MLCHYITATMAPQGNEASVRRLAKASLLRWDPVEHPGVCASLAPGERYYLTTRGSCDCGTAIGLARRSHTALLSQQSDFSRDIRNLKKKGWSSAKIDRWIEQSKADSARKQQETASRLSGQHIELQRWVQFIASVLDGDHAKSIGVLLHWYSGDLTTEAIDAGNRRWLSHSELTEDYLLHAEEDVLHTFRS
ncbi:MAG: hypothetical protein ACKN9U_26590 [Pirellulaceae bacterium]